VSPSSIKRVFCYSIVSKQYQKSALITKSKTME